MMFEERVAIMDREHKTSTENFNHKAADTIPEFSDDSDIEILTPNDVEESSSSWAENNCENTQETEGLEATAYPSSDVEIIHLSSDDEETSWKDNTLESRNETVDCASEGSESSDEQIKIEIDTGSEKINIKPNNCSNLDELFLGSDEECIMFDFSNYSADDVLRAVENNKLLIDEDVTRNVNVETYENFAEPIIDLDESEVSVTDTGTELEVATCATNNNVNNKTDAAEINNQINKQSPCRTNGNTSDSETHLILKCRKCFAPGITEINIDINTDKREKCPNCLFNMSYQCTVCTCLFHSIFSFSNHLKNYHMKENEKILKSIDNLQLINNSKRKRKTPTHKKNQFKNLKQDTTGKNVVVTRKVKSQQKTVIARKVKTVRKGSKVKKVQQNKQKNTTCNTFVCVNCSQAFGTLQYLQLHRVNCHIIPYLYCRFCPISISSKTELRKHMIHYHSLIINQSDLNQILDGIEQEGKKLMDMKSVLLATCIGCKYVLQLDHRVRHCDRCRSTLIYKCGDRRCQLMYNTLGQLISHVRQQHLHTWHRCSICGTGSIECGEAARHRLLHHPESHLTYRHCKDCHYEATSPGDLSSHEMSAHEPSPATLVKPYQGPYVCHACGRTFKLEARLRQHQRSFCKKICRTFKCAHCRYTSFDKEKLLEHLRCSHVYLFTGRNLRCQRCGVEVPSIYKLNDHMGKCMKKRKVQR